MSNSERWSWIILLLLCILVGFKGGQFYEKKKTADFQDQFQSQVEEKVKSKVKESLAQLKKELKKDRVKDGQMLDENSKSDPLFSSSSPFKRLNSTVCPPPPPLECPPCDCRPPKKRRVKKGKKVPPPPQLTPLERRKLLAWVKRNASTLKSCRDASQPIYRLTIMLKLKKKTRGIESVVLKGRDIPRSTGSCIQNKIKKWPLDPSLNAKKHPHLVFGLQLD